MLIFAVLIELRNKVIRYCVDNCCKSDTKAHLSLCIANLLKSDLFFFLSGNIYSDYNMLYTTSRYFR